MKNIVNGGVYDLNLNGTNDAEFIGNHPTIIFKSIKNREMYYVIPLTTYTIERWKIYRKNYCCRIVSTNSIARIDKVKIMHRLEITHRWFKNDMILIPKPEEMQVVINKYLEYIAFSAKAAMSDYSKYYSNYNHLYKVLYNHFEEYIFSDNISMYFSNDKCECTFDSNLCSKLTFDDIRHIIFSLIGKENVMIKYNKTKKIIHFVINNNYKKLLQLQNKYVNIISTKGNTNKTSVVNM